jgi:hypothetical protein
LSFSVAGSQYGKSKSQIARGVAAYKKGRAIGKNGRPTKLQPDVEEELKEYISIRQKQRNSISKMELINEVLYYNVKKRNKIVDNK